ncbi:MAG: SRPBCC domain-containing protein [Saprospiraceae bacterium]
MSNTILHDVIITADMSSIFEAISEPKHLNNWWTQKCTGIARINSKYNLHFNESYDWYGTVTVCIIDKSFSISMTDATTKWMGTTFGFNIEPIDSEKTRLKFFHKDWKEIDEDFRHTSYCWAILLSHLKDYLEQSIILPFEKRGDC